MNPFYDLNKRLADLSAKQDATKLAESKQAETVAQSPLTQALMEAPKQIAQLKKKIADYDEVKRRIKWGKQDPLDNPYGEGGSRSDVKSKTKGTAATNRTLKSNIKRSLGTHSSPVLPEAEELDERSTGDYSAKAGRAGKDLGKPGKNFSKIAKGAAERYGSKAAGERVAGAVLNKLRHPKEDIENEGNAFTGKLKSTAKGEKFKLGDKEFKDTSSIEENYNPVRAVKQCAKDYMKMNGIRSVHDLEAEDIESIGGDCQINYQDVCEILGCNLPDSLGPVKSWDTDEHGNKFDLEEGFADMDAWLAQREKEKGTGKFDRKERTLPGGMKATTYTRKHEDDKEDDSDAPEDKGGAPKKKGRPQSAAPKDSERVTKGSHKYDVVDGKRVKKVKEGDMEGSHDSNEAGEFGAEGDYVKNELHTMVRVARDLERHLSDNEDLPTWCIGKLSQAKGMVVSVMDYIMSEKERGVEANTGEEGIRIAERSKSQAQARMMAGAAHDPKFAKKVGVKQSVAKEFNKADTGKKMSSLPKKVKAKEEVDETTTSGSVATVGNSAPKASKGGMSFGKGVYESFNNSLEKMISESIDVTETVNEHEQEGKTITVTASGPEADMLMQLLKAAGLSGQGQSQGCGCGTTPCSCETVDEAYGDTDETLNNPDWPTDTEKSDNAFQYSGGLNGPKSTGQTTTVGGGIPNMQARRQVSMEENVKLERSLFKTWKNYKG